MIDPVSPEVNSESAAAGKKLAGDLDAFLLLLTTQLKHQDPLSPLEPTEFTGQLVAFAGVEQQITTNKNLENLVALQNSNFAAAIVGFIGTVVEAENNQMPLQNGTGDFTYELSNNAKGVAIVISNAGGKVVHAVQGEITAGTHAFTWDGKDQNGVQQPDGAYTVSVTALGFEDDPVETSVLVKGKVTGVSMQSGEAVLDVGGVKIALPDVVSINEAESQ